MRHFGLALFMLVGLVHPTFADSTKIRLSITLDWSKFHEQEALANDLQEKGKLPLPMIFVRGQLRGLVPSKIDVESSGTPAEIDVGVPQIVERPLYIVQIAQSGSGGVTAQVDSVDFAVVANSDFVEGRGPAVVLKGISHSKLVISKSTILSDHGIVNLALPAAPLAALTTFALKTGNGMAEGHIVPLVLRGNKYDYAPFSDLVRSGVEKSGFNLATAVYRASKNAQPIYKGVVDTRWTLGVLPLGRIYKWVYKGLAAQTPQPLVVQSDPSRAAVYLGGNRYLDRMTTAKMNILRGLWDDISLRLKGYQDCPVVSECPVVPGKATVPPGGSGPTVFLCKLQRQ